MQSLDSMSMSAICHELVAVRFRNCMFSHIRARLSHSLGSSWQDDVFALFKNDWEKLERSSGLSIASGLDGRAPLDRLDLLGVNQLRNMFDKWFEILVPEKAVPDSLGAAKKLKQRLDGWLGELSDLRNPAAHPQDEDLSAFDVFRAAGTILKIMRLLAIVDDEDRFSSTYDYILGRLATAPTSSIVLARLENSLPSRSQIFDSFVGRTSHLEALWTWFVDEEARQWVLVGEGGHGKSSIAFEFAAEVVRQNPNGLEAVWWLSAKKVQYVDANSVPVRNPDFWDLDSALNVLLREFGYNESLAKSVDAKRLQVLDLLDEFPSLVVFDDLDSIAKAAEDVVEFVLFEIPRTKSRVMITSRRLYPGMSRCSTTVSGMQEEEAEEFLRVTADRLGVGSDRTDVVSAFKKIRDVTESSPLYMEDLLRLCRHEKALKAIDRWTQHSGDSVRRYALARERELLSATAREVLDACCLAGTALSVEELERILGKSADEVMSGLHELESSYLVPQAQLIEDVPKFRAHRNLESWLRREIAESEPTLKNAVDAVLGASGRGSRSAVDAQLARQVRLLLRDGRTRRALEIAERESAAAPNTPRLLALRAEARAGQRPPELADARSDWNRAAQLGLSDPESFLRWAAAEEHAGQWQRMYDALHLGIEACGDNGGRLEHQAGYALTRMGKSQLSKYDTVSGRDTLTRAERHLRSALAKLKSRSENYLINKCYRSLVINSQFLRNDQSVEYWLLEWRKDQPESQELRQEATRVSSNPRIAKAFGLHSPAV